MDQEEFDTMEVKALNVGWYFVSLYQFKKANPLHPDYIKDWMEFKDNKWDYGGYDGSCYVCFIHKKE